MSKNLESPGHDRETRPVPANLSDLRKRVYPTLFVRRRDPKVFPVILRMHERRPSGDQDSFWQLFCLVRGKRRLQPLPAWRAIGAKAGTFAYAGRVGEPSQGGTPLRLW